MPYRFTFVVNGHTRYTAELQGQQCNHVNPNTHRRCKNRVVIGVDLCWLHDRTDLKLKIAQSTIPNAGKGLFAYDNKLAGANGPRPRRGNPVVFYSGAMICRYNGQIITAEKLHQRYGEFTAPYGMTVNQSRGIYEDGATRRGIGSLANTNTDHNINAHFEIRNGVIVLVANKPIRNNEEIFADYGNDYGLHEEGVNYYTK